MHDFKIKKCTVEDLDEVKKISERTFYETFASENSKEDMEKYLEETFAKDKMKAEIETEGSIFYIVTNGENTMAYMKVNFDNAQTEEGYTNSLEVQRIYVLEDYKNMKIGKSLIDEAKEIAANEKLDYIWLGVWEHNLNAIRFYEKQGFVKFDTHIFKLGDDEQTDNLMKYTLKK